MRIGKVVLNDPLILWKSGYVYVLINNEDTPYTQFRSRFKKNIQTEILIKAVNSSFFRGFVQTLKVVTIAENN